MGTLLENKFPVSKLPRENYNWGKFPSTLFSGNFWYYGYDTVKYNMLSKAEQKVNVDPMCNVFPTEVSCVIPNVGAAGGGQDLNGMCVLSQNIINEKMYFVLWFWMVFLIMLFPICIVYRVLTICFNGPRSAVLFGKIHYNY